MAKLARKTVRLFGTSGTSTDFGQFGSKLAGSPQTSKDPTVLQQLSRWLTGWTAAAVGAAFNPYLEDMNAFCYVAFYFIFNLFERGIADWDAGTTYDKGAYVGDPAGSGQIWYSLTDANLNNTPPIGASNAQWQWANPPAILDGGVTAGKIPKMSAAGPGVAVDSILSETGGNIKLASGGVQFADNTVQTTAPVNPAVTVQSPPSPYVGPVNRVLNAVYQNTGTKPIFVVVAGGSSGSWNLTVRCDGNPSPATIIGVVSAGSSAPGSFTIAFVVLPGYYYKVTGSALTHWTEWT